MKKPNTYSDQSQELFGLFEQASGASKVMCVPIDYAKKDHVAIRFSNTLLKSSSQHKIISIHSSFLCVLSASLHSCIFSSGRVPEATDLRSRNNAAVEKAIIAGAFLLITKNTDMEANRLRSVCNSMASKPWGFRLSEMNGAEGY